MNKKGQIVSIDFLLSIILVVFAVGMIIQFTEQNSYIEKQELIFNDLKRVGDTAGTLIVSNPDIVCSLVDNFSGEVIDSLNNCIPANADINKEVLGIPAGYECNLTVQGITFPVNECDSAVPTDKDIYSVKREVVTYTTIKDVPKSVIENCAKGDSCAFNQATIHLRVWK